MQDSNPIPYRLVVKQIRALDRNYHTIELNGNDVVVTIRMKWEATEKNINFYLKNKEDQIQSEIKEARIKKTLPKLPKSPAVLKSVPKRKEPIALSPAIGSLIAITFYCKKCGKLSYKGYLGADGSYMCRDCRNLERNPNPKPRLVYQAIESGKKR